MFSLLYRPFFYTFFLDISSGSALPPSLVVVSAAALITMARVLVATLSEMHSAVLLELVQAVLCRFFAQSELLRRTSVTIH